MPSPLATPVVQPVDQSTDAVLVTNTVVGAHLSLSVGGNAVTASDVATLLLGWALAGNTASFGQVADHRPFWTGSFRTPGTTDILFYAPADGNWWLGAFTADQLAWEKIGNTSGAFPGARTFGKLTDGRPFWTGDFTGSGTTDLLFYYPGDGNWWLGTHDGTKPTGLKLQWDQIGNTSGAFPGATRFGNIADGRPFWTGDFTGMGKADILFYEPNDGDWWLGVYDGTQGEGLKLRWEKIGNTSGAFPGARTFGKLTDGRPFWTGDFTGSGTTDLLFYYPGDGNWWLGTYDGSQPAGLKLVWEQIGNTSGAFPGAPNFGHLTDGRPFWTGAFSTPGTTDLLFYAPADGNWWLGVYDGTRSEGLKLRWQLIGNTSGAVLGAPSFGNLADGRPFWTGAFTGLDRTNLLFYAPGDGNWWLGVYDGSHLAWTPPANTRGFGPLADGRPFWTGDFTGTGKTDLLFYYPGDKNWWLGTFDGARIPLPHPLAPGDTVSVTQTLPSLPTQNSSTVTVEHNVTMQGYDKGRTGWNPHEATFTVASVRAHCAVLFTQGVQGQVYAQPLYVQDVAIPGKGTHNVVYVATEDDMVYAFDADTKIPALWERSLVPGGEAMLVSDDVRDVGGPCQNVDPHIGITATPVIDRTTNTLYVVAKTKRADGSAVFQRLHALDLATGMDRTYSPVEIQGSFPGSADFDPRWQLNRPALLLSNDAVYIAFGAHCDKGDYHGWVFAYDAATLNQHGVFNAAPQGGNGIWQAGFGLAADEHNAVYCQTGNGPFSPNFPPKAYGNSILKLQLQSPWLTVVDSFTPFDQLLLQQNDWDLGSGGAMVIPDQGGGAHPRLLVGCGKQGFVYLIDRDGMGGYNGNGTGPDRVVQRIELQPGKTPTVPGLPLGSDRVQPGIFGGPAYYHGPGGQFVYCAGNTGPLVAFQLGDGQLVRKSASTVPICSQPIGVNSGDPVPSGSGFPNGGTTPAVSSNAAAAGTGVVWAVNRADGVQADGLTLYAYDATDLTQTLAHCTVGKWTNAGRGSPFTLLTVIRGKVYVGTGDGLTVVS